MIKDNLSENILKNPHYLDLKDSGKVRRKRSISIVPILLLTILSIIPLFILYAVSVGFIIGGFNYVFSNIIYLRTIDLQMFSYYLIIGIIGLGLIISAFYLTSFIIRLIRK